MYAKSAVISLPNNVDIALPHALSFDASVTVIDVDDDGDEDIEDVEETVSAGQNRTKWNYRQ